MAFFEIKNLRVAFPDRSGTESVAVDDVSFSIKRGTTVGLVGESGSGKTTIGRALLHLLPAGAKIGGRAVFDGQEILARSEREFRPLRSRMQMIFQDPFNSLNPRQRVGSIIAEPLGIHCPEQSRQDRSSRVSELLRQVGLPTDAVNRLPHEFSGGQRQRIGIARALAARPEFLVLDEPVSALDVSVQAQIVNLLGDLQRELGLTYLFVGHDLAVIEHLSDQILVLLHGRVVENAPAVDLLAHPREKFTRELIAAARGELDF